MKTLVVGGTGKVGSAVIRELRQRGAQVRILTRKGTASNAEGIEVAVGDLLDPPSLAKAMEGVDKLFLLNAVVADELTQGLIAYGMARRMKLQHIVYLSVFRADHFKDVPHFASKLAIENALQEFDLPFTILRPNYFFQNDLGLKDALMQASIYPIPLGDMGITAVDVRDIAEAAAVALTSKGHEGKTYNLNGPERLSGPTAAAIWSRLLEKPIQYTGHNMDTFEEMMRQRGPAWTAFDMRVMFEGYLERGFVAEKHDLERLTSLLGHAPRRYQDFVAEALRSWRAVTS